MYGKVIEIVLFSAERSAEGILHKSNVYTYSLKYLTDCLSHHEIEIVIKYTYRSADPALLDGAEVRAGSAAQ